MKFMVDFGNGTIWSLLLPPNALFWAAIILAVLLIAKWYFALQHRKIQSTELKEINYDNREKEAARNVDKSDAGNRPQGTHRAYDEHPLHREKSRNLQ